MLNVIVTGGLGAGKTNLIERLAGTGIYVIGSPATTMKRSLAKVIARTYNEGSSSQGTDYGWQTFYDAMMDRHEKEKYRGILQGYGEHFSNADNFFWIHRSVAEVQAELGDIHYLGEGRHVDGTIWDSIRRPSEIVGIREAFPDAFRVHLEVSLTRQLSYLVNTLGYKLEQAKKTLDHSSEHWLDNSDDKPDLTIDADKGDEYVWAIASPVFREKGANL